MFTALPHTLVVIPTYNECVNLPLITHRIMRETPYSLLIVDDNSPDGTGRIADELATHYADRMAVLHRTGARGLGRSYLDGMRHALALGADRVCQMDADLSHGPEYLTALVEATEDADVAVGSRYLTGVSVANWPLRRLLLSVGANAYVRLITGLPVRDTTSGFKCWRREALTQVLAQPIRSDGYALQFEMLVHAHRFNRRIVEVPIIFVERREGTSKMSGRVIFESMLRPLALLFSRGVATPERARRHVAADLRELATDLQARPRPTKPAEHQP
jgi:dolichol-phosphate mannosyltransferase